LILDGDEGRACANDGERLIARPAVVILMNSRRSSTAFVFM